MKWLEKWMNRRQVNDLKHKIVEMKADAEKAQADHLILSACTISHRIRLLEKALETAQEKVEPRRLDPNVQDGALHS